MTRPARRTDLRLAEQSQHYRHVDEDPEMAEVCRMIEDSGRPLSWIEAKSGVRAQTISRWLTRKTRRPQNLTLKFVGKALGKRRVWVDDD